MNLLIAAVLSEHRKLRRTLARALSLITPAAAVLFGLFVLGNIETLAAAKQTEQWLAYAQALMRMWTLFLLPMMITLQAVLLAQLEHANRQWKYLLTLPLPRTHLFLAKMVNLLILVLLAHGVLLGLAASSIAIAGLVPPGTQGAMAVATYLVPTVTGAACASMLLAAIQLWIAIRFDSFVGSVAIGLVATLVAVLGSSALGQKAAYYPWTMPLHSLEHGSVSWLLTSMGAAAVAIGIGAYLMKRMQVR